MFGETRHLREAVDRNDARHDRHRNAGSTGAIDKTEIEVIVEEELRDCPRCSCIDLGFEIVDIRFHRDRIRMFFRIGGNGNLEIRDLANTSGQITCIFIAVRIEMIVVYSIMGSLRNITVIVILTTEKAIEQAKENFRINQERFKEQVSTTTEVLIAQTLLSNTLTNYFDALYNFKIAKATLYRAMGQEVME